MENLRTESLRHQGTGVEDTETVPRWRRRGLPSNGGFTLIELMIVVAIIAVIAALAIPNLQAARVAANEASALSSLRNVFSVQEQYRARFGQFSVALSDLQASGYLDTLLGTGMKSGYRFENPTSTGNLSWSLEANPSVPGRTGNRYFFVDQTGVIRFATASNAGATDTPID